MNRALVIQNRQRTYAVDSRRLRAIAQGLVQNLLRTDSFELGVYLVAAPEMTRLNETYLHHQGSTDVLAFDYSPNSHHGSLSGELFICVDEARIQAARFHTSWQSEVVRYLVHGLLHLNGYDDRRRDSRRRMKREENRLLRELSRMFDFSKL